MSRRTLPLLVAALAACSVLLWARLPGAPRPFAYGFALLWLLRVLWASDGRALVGPRRAALLLGALLACGLPYLLTSASEGTPHELFLRLLGVLTCFQGVLLLLPLATFGAFWSVLLATLAVAVTCSLETDLAGALLVPAYVGLLAVTLLVLERRWNTLAPARAGEPLRRVLLDPGSPAGPPLWRGARRLVARGLVLGLALWLVAPRPGHGGEEARLTRAGSEALEREAGGLARGVASSTGPDAATQDALLGAVEEIQQDKRVHWEVRLLAGSAEPPLLLREAVRDLWSDPRSPASPRWRSSREAERHPLVPAADGWVTLADAEPGLPERTLEARARLGVGLLFLEPEPLAFRVERPLGEEEDAPRETLVDETQSVGSGRLRRAVLGGDVVRMRSQPQRRDGPELRGRESSARVAPLTSYARIAPDLAQALRELTADVPGIEASDAWTKALALEGWLRGPGFRYELRSPSLEPGRRVLDFLTRVRRGNCEWYATALTLALRAHGMASRYVQGYWGGSHTPASNLWTFYGAHYHAWTELYLDGVGWVPLNPTPPERLAEGADPRTGESQRSPLNGEAQAQVPAPPPAERLRAWIAERVRALARGMGDLASRVPWGGAALLVALVLGLVGLRARRWRQQGARRGGGGPAHGPYLEALRVLALRGQARPPSRTAREHLRRVRDALPPAAGDAFERLTERHERERYAGVVGTEPEARRELKAFLLALGPAREPERT